MSYISGFVAAVPEANKEAFRKHAGDAAPIFVDYGAMRVVECWGDDVPEGTVTDFKGAVKAEADEVVVFSWVEWPSKQVCEEGFKKMMKDPRMKQMSDMPFDGKRMIWGGFETLVDVNADR